MNTRQLDRLRRTIAEVNWQAEIFCQSAQIYNIDGSEKLKRKNLKE